jgi:hypothetical protein
MPDPTLGSHKARNEFRGFDAMAPSAKTTYEALRRALRASALFTPRCRNLSVLVRKSASAHARLREAGAVDEMKAAMTRMRGALGRRKFLAACGAFAALAASIAALAGGDALAQNAADCARLQQAIASRHGSSGAQAAAERQRAELARTTANARALGCENRKFLFLGSDPPPQCGEINGQISRMQANLADLQARAGGGAGDLIARYNAECVNAPARGPSNIFEALFGGVARLAAPPPQPQMDVRVEPLDREEGSANREGQRPQVEAHSGSYAVCVRTCDGSFFPVSYTGAGSRADSLEEVCRALCPNADMALYSFPFGGTIDEAASASGEPYANLPNAGKFQQTYDPNCSCRRRGQSWAEALADAEARYGHEKHDILVTPEKSAEMARPIIDPKAKPTTDPKAKSATPSVEPAADAGSATVTGSAPVLDASGADAKLRAEAATISREGSGIAGDDVQGAKSFSRNQGQAVEVTGPDGVKRWVRIVGPAL